MNSPNVDFKQQLTSKLEQILSHLRDGEATTVCVINDRWIGHLIIDPVPTPVKTRRRPEMEMAIEQSLRDGKVLVAKEIARATGYSYNSRLRACLTDLARRGAVVRTPDGYRLAP